MEYVKMIEQARKEMLQEVKQRCDKLIQQYQNGEQRTQPKTTIRECKLGWVSLAVLKGKRPLSGALAGFTKMKFLIGYGSQSKLINRFPITRRQGHIRRNIHRRPHDNAE